MKDTPLSTLERQFLLSALTERKRLDGRGLNELRKVDICLGTDWGSCLASVGDTLVLAQVSCELTEPQTSRPNEGILRIDVDFAGMAGAAYAEGRNQTFQEELVELHRLMERCLRESGCIDMESLCVISESVVWCIRLELSVLNNAGNLAQVANLAGLTALCHFRRPEVTLKGDEVTVHPEAERDPVPLAIHHHPVCFTFAFFNADGDSTAERVVVIDPTWQEEQVMTGKLVFGINPYREICTLHLAGNMLIDKKVVLQHAHQAAMLARTIVDLIKNKLATDSERRRNREMDKIGFAYEMLAKQQSILKNQSDPVIDVAALRLQDEETKENEAPETSEEEGLKSVKGKATNVNKGASPTKDVDDDGDSEEETTETIRAMDVAS